MFKFLGVEGGSGVPGVFDLVIYGVVALGVPRVVALGVNGLVSLSVPVNVAHGITGAIDSVFPGLVSLGSAIYVTNQLRLKR